MGNQRRGNPLSVQVPYMRRTWAGHTASAPAACRGRFVTSGPRPITTLRVMGETSTASCCCFVAE